MLCLLLALEATAQFFLSQDETLLGNRFPRGYRWSGEPAYFSMYNMQKIPNVKEECMVQQGAMKCYKELSRAIVKKRRYVNPILRCSSRRLECNASLVLNRPTGPAITSSSLNNINLDALLNHKQDPYGSCFYGNLIHQKSNSLPDIIIIDTLYALLQVSLSSYSLDMVLLHNKTVDLRAPLVLRSGRCNFFYAFDQ
ncbi:hypothetical protein DSO57_1003225 [Entomophthora muscae]|uniref:Uncharacterized protein n=1 Tax=Entomophthora muscae TaxID=34485 RepID=A0ACC2TWM9_9FUNG|nr:hypothetical protein DSO57_1003225 [Entomophthora muscae]